MKPETSTAPLPAKSEVLCNITQRFVDRLLRAYPENASRSDKMLQW
jgi:hypothetical protein